MRVINSWRIWRLGLLLLLLSACLAQDTGHERGSISKEDDQLSESAKQRSEESTEHLSRPVEEALAILRPLQSQRNSRSRTDRSHGVFDTSLYYGKKAFFFLFMNRLPQDQIPIKLSKPLSTATTILKEAAEAWDADAIYLLGELNFHGNYTHPRNFSEAFRWYRDLATLNGNASAQHMLGFMYATGIAGSVVRDQARALIFHTFAAKGGDTRAQMTVAYRHHAGVGTPRNCDEAAVYYKEVADKAIVWSRNGPPGGMTIDKESYRLADEEGGVYGEGASVVSSGPYAHASFDDVLEYLDLISRKGDLQATFSLGGLHYDGSRTMKRNLRTAQERFLAVARKYWAKDGSKLTDDARTAKIASKAAGYLGRMFLRGEGTEQSFEKAMIWFKRGLVMGDALCQYQIGLMHLEGHGVRQDAIKAVDFLKEAANQDLASAQVRLGQLFLDQGDVGTAIRYFRQSAQAGHIEAFYHLAEINNYGIGQERSCAMATAYYKAVAEKVEILHSSFGEANRAYEAGDKETALIVNMMAAEQGYESAQANVAYILDERRSILPLDSAIPWKQRRTPLLRNAILALMYWTRSAQQSNIDSLVKMGDYYLAGNGADADVDKAASCYQTAGETHHNAQALWNLGWIHENGIGVEQDFHLAKRFYDQALETNQGSYLPVQMALTKLRLRSFWNTITRGKANSIKHEAPDSDATTEWTVREWLAKFAEQARTYHGEDEDDDFVDVSDGIPGGDELYDDLDSDLIETAIIVGLVATLALMVWYRNQRQTNAQRQQQQQGPAPVQGQVPVQPQGQAPAPVPGPQADGGFFPPPGDPNHAQWVAGGVGH